MHGGQRGELACAQAMAAVVEERKLTVAPLHGGARALEQVRAVAGELFNLRALLLLRRQGLEWMIWCSHAST